MNDTARVRWTDADWLEWLNDGHRDACLIKNDVYVVNSSILLTPSVTRQDLPPDGLMLMSLTRNMGADGLTTGRAIRVAARDALDAQVPGWHSDPEDLINGILNYMYDPRDPYHYYCYPMAPSTAWWAELVYGAIPPDMPTLGDVILLRDVYANALLDYILFRANSRDEVQGQPNPAAQMYFQKFTAAFGLKGREEAQNSPNLTTTPGAPVPAAAAAKPV